jgi:small-conductance mechanosensitive channel
MLTICTVIGLLLTQQVDTTTIAVQDTLVAIPTARDSMRTTPPAAIPVVFSDDTLFSVYSPLGEFEATERAQQIANRLRTIARSDLPVDSLVLQENNNVTDALLDTLRVFSVTAQDAAAMGSPRLAVAEGYKGIIIDAVKERRTELSLKSILSNLGITLGLLAILGGLFWVMKRFFPWLYARIDSFEGTLFRTIRIRSFELIDAATVTGFHLAAAKGVRLVLSLILVYIFLSVTFSLFPFSRGWDLEPIFRGVLLSLVATVFGAGLWKLGATFFTVARKKFNEWKGTVIRGVRIREFELFSEDRIVALSLTLVTGVQYAGVLLLGYAYLTIVFSVFEFSRTWAQTLFGYVTDPVLEVLTSFVAFLPDLFFIIVVVAITRFVLKIIKGIFEEVSRGRVTLGNFHRDWAMPTYQIVRFLVIAFAAVVIFPYLPGSGSAAFQGISVFLGILFSLGSSSAIANMVAGIVITYMRPFQIGDRVKIADTAGDVVERNLLVTRVRTVKNVDVTIPNAMVLGSHIINYSSTSGTRSLILHTSVTIGYDVPWRKVHELLLAAAKDSKEILEDPAPFVLQTSLDDYSVAYELNAHTDNPSRMAAIYSDLHQNIQDKFNEAGVEIMSPSYSAVRDGNQVTIPPDYLPKEYTPASFRIFPLGNLFSSQTKRQESEKGEKS